MKQPDLLRNFFKKTLVKQLILIGLVVAAFFFLLNLNYRLSSVFTNRRTVETLQTEVVALYATDIALRTEIAEVQSEHAVEEFSREAGYIQAQDVPVAVVGIEGDLPDLSVPDEPAVTRTYENWELWMYLLFGKVFP
ncbi:MAG: hypothetical protein HPY85_02930 [Anaerolineae bacterium]|nr:hypothetical protein [Anaerolineae bacterium]